MINQCTIINYHYVRNTSLTNSYGLKARSISEFQNQVDYLKKYFHFITINDCIDAINSQTVLPENAAMLTFDDGYIDHYQNVFPILDERDIKGSFFIPTNVLSNREVLDVNKIHFLLAKITDAKKLIKIIFKYLDHYRKEYLLESNEYFFKKLAHSNRWDSKEIRFIKVLLQTELPHILRKIIIDKLFMTYVTNDKKAFADELYMSVKQVKHMIESGMYIGWHGSQHNRLTKLSIADQEKEILQAIDFFNEFESHNHNFIISYPYGDFNNSLIKKLKKNNFVMGLTVKVGIAQMNKNNAFELPRLDTNDFPTEINAPPNKWVMKATK